MSNQAMRPGPTSAGRLLSGAAPRSPATSVETTVIAWITFRIVFLLLAARETGRMLAQEASARTG